MNDTLFSVGSPEELLSQLEKIDISHPEVGAAKEQLERCVCFRFLSTFAKESQFAFPLKLTHVDRPDFRVIMNSRTIGIECTQALSEQFARARSLREQHCPDVWIDLSYFRQGCPDRTSAEIIELLKKNRFTGEPWYGKAADKEWANTMEACIEVKTDKLNADGFARFVDNWLLIDDDFIPQSILDFDNCLDYLLPKLEKYFAANHNTQTKFNEIIIRHQSDFVRLTPTSGQIKSINDLWQKHGN